VDIHAVLLTMCRLALSPGRRSQDKGGRIGVCPDIFPGARRWRKAVAQDGGWGEGVITVAYVRAVSPRLDACALTHVGRVPIDAERAAAQHAAYVRVLAASGLPVRWLSAMPEAPDGVFVEDAAVVLDGDAVITRPGDPGRAAETASVAAGLADRLQLRHLAAGRLDGGDVLRVGRTLFVGLSRRTDAAGVAALRAIVAPLGFAVEPVQVTGCLHLKTAATWLAPHDGDDAGTLLLNPAWLDAASFGDLPRLAVDASEPWAANTLQIGGQVLIGGGKSAHRGRAGAARLCGDHAEYFRAAEGRGGTDLHEPDRLIGNADQAGRFCGAGFGDWGPSRISVMRARSIGVSAAQGARAAIAGPRQRDEPAPRRLIS
jgi:dimethylargininase